MPISRQHALLIGGIALSALFLFLSLRDTDLAQIAAAFDRAALWLALPLLLALALYFWLKALRWRLLLSPLCRVTTRGIIPPMMVGYASNIILPAQLGELARMVLASRQLGVPNAPVLTTIVLERMFDFLTLLCFLGAVLLLDRAAPAALRDVGYVVGAIAAALLASVAAFVAWTERALALMRRLTRGIPRALAARIDKQAAMAAEGLRAIRSPRLLLGIVVTSLAQWGFMGVCTYIGVAAIGISAPISAGFTVLAFTVAGLTLPSSPGFIGTVQLAFTLGLRPYGVSAADAFAASVFYHLLVYVSVLITGLIYLRRLGFRLRDVTRAATPPPDESPPRSPS